MKKIFISGLLTASLTIGTVLAGFTVSGVSSYGASFSDIDEHWAKSYILDAAEKGIISGYPDGTFLPDNPVTRAEFTKMVNNALGNNASSTLTFSDVPSIEWYYNEVSKAVAAGYAGGYDDGTFLPNNKISRQEAAVMLSRIVPTYNYNSSLKTYGDYANVSDWAESSLSRIVGKKYMGAYDDGLLHPLDSLTRAQAAKIICDIVKKETIVKNALTISKEDTKVSNRIYSNGITINKNVEEGDVTIDNCMVLGTLYVQGGGADEGSDDGVVTINNSRVASMQISKTDSAVQITASNETRILEANVWKTAHLHTSSLDGGLFGTGFDKIKIYGGAEAYLDGNFPLVFVSGADCHVNFESGTITTLNVESTGKNSEITLDDYATVTTANVDALSLFRGDGEIKTMNANANGITYETKPDRINTKSGVTAPKYSDADSDISCTPERGKTGVAVNTEIKLSFSSAITKYSGKTISNSDLEDLIELREKSASGSKVDFSAEINSSKKTITITPDDDLDYDKKYYVVIDANTFKYTDGKGNDSFSTYFTTEDEDDADISVSPSKNAKDVAVGTTIKLTFDSAIKRYNGNTITSSVLDDIIDDKEIELRKGSSSGTRISIDASINSSKKIITITPNSNLDYDTTYYVILDKNTFKDSGNNGNAAFSSYFRTVANGNTISKISFGDEDEDSIKATVTVSSSTTGKVFGVLLPASDATLSSSRIINGQDSKGSAVPTNRVKNSSISKNGSVTWTFEDLEPNTSYKLHTVLQVGSVTSSVKSESAKTADLPGAKLKSLTVKNENSNLSLSPKFSADTRSYEAVAPFESSNITITAEPENSNALVNFMIGGGPWKTGDDSPNSISFPISGVSETVKIMVSETGKQPLTYEVVAKIAGNTELDNLSVLYSDSHAESIDNPDGTKNYLVPSGVTSVQVRITAKDSNAVIKCDKLSPNSGKGSLSGTLSLNGATEISYTIESNLDKDSYRFTVTPINAE